MRHDYAQLSQVRLHYVECGAGDDLVILLHGFPECWYSWRHQLPVLGERYHVVAPDMRGYNLSDKPKGVESYRIELLVQDIVELIDHFSRRKPPSWLMIGEPASPGPSLKDIRKLFLSWWRCRSRRRQPGGQTSPCGN